MYTDYIHLQIAEFWFHSVITHFLTYIYSLSCMNNLLYLDLYYTCPYCTKMWRLKNILRIETYIIQQNNVSKYILITF